MEEAVNYSNGDDMFPWLPIGHMIAHVGQVPTNFVIVDGQKLYKSKYPLVYKALKGCVLDDGDVFVLPKRDNIMHMFSDYYHTNDCNIILRVA